MKKRILSLALAVMVIVVLVPISTMAANALDTAAEWARDGIKSAVTKGFVPVDLQNNYSNVITRQEFCRMAVKWLEYKTGKNIDTLLAEQGVSRRQDAFSDTNDTDILAAYALGITSGTSAPTTDKPGQFTPSGQFSREQAATMIRNVCKVADMDVSNITQAGFTDINTASSWAIDSINFVRNAGIMSGTSATALVFNPKGTYTRQESIVTFDRITAQPSTTTPTMITYNNTDLKDIPVKITDLDISMDVDSAGYMVLDWSYFNNPEYTNNKEIEITELAYRAFDTRDGSRVGTVARRVTSEGGTNENGYDTVKSIGSARVAESDAYAMWRLGDSAPFMLMDKYIDVSYMPYLESRFTVINIRVREALMMTQEERDRRFNNFQSGIQNEPLPEREWEYYTIVYCFDSKMYEIYDVSKLLEVDIDILMDRINN